MTPSNSTRPFDQVRLGPIEQQVMEAVWERGELTIREVITHLGGHHAYTTIATVLSNLGRKELVTSRRVGRSAHFRPLHPRAEHAARLMSQALSASNDRGASILRFVEWMDARDVALLREYLDGTGAPGTGGGASCRRSSCSPRRSPSSRGPARPWGDGARRC